MARFALTMLVAAVLTVSATAQEPYVDSSHGLQKLVETQQKLAAAKRGLSQFQQEQNQRIREDLSRSRSPVGLGWFVAVAGAAACGLLLPAARRHRGT